MESAAAPLLPSAKFRLKPWVAAALLAAVVGCSTGAMTIPRSNTPLVVGQPILGWMEYRLGMDYRDAKKVLNSQGFKVRPASGQVNSSADPEAWRSFLFSTPASLDAILLPEDSKSGTRQLFAFGYYVDALLPKDTVVLLLVFNREHKLQAVSLLFRQMPGGVNLEDYAQTVIAPQLDRKYQRAQGLGPYRGSNETFARWIDPKSQNQIALFGLKKPSPGLVVLGYLSGVEAGILSPIF